MLCIESRNFNYELVDKNIESGKKIKHILLISDLSMNLGGRGNFQSVIGNKGVAKFPKLLLLLYLS